jgi:hypothetical protein
VLDCLLPGIGGCQSMVIARLVWWYVGFWRAEVRAGETSCGACGGAG